MSGNNSNGFKDSAAEYEFQCLIVTPETGSIFFMARLEGPNS